jgi:hypothetical protein
MFNSFFTCSTNPSLPTTSDRLLAPCLRLIPLRPIHDTPFEIVATMGDVPEKAEQENDGWHEIVFSLP